MAPKRLFAQSDSRSTGFLLRVRYGPPILLWVGGPFRFVISNPKGVKYKTMPIPKKEASRKAETVESVSVLLKESQAVILTDYRGLTVTQINDIRKKLRDSDASFAVVKNTLLKRAADATFPADAQRDAALNGPTAVAFATKDAVLTSKTLLDYIASNRTTPLKIKGAVVGGKFYDSKGVDALSKVPPREVLISQMLGSFNAPITGLVGTLNGIISNFVFTLQAIHDKQNEASA
jgi:large subunit ribosomal protein L10